MKRLGEILVERGALAIDELHTGLEACHHRGGRLGTQLLRFGFVDEHALLEALSEQLGVPPAPTRVLLRAPHPLRRLLPLEAARRLQAVIFDRRDGLLSVAMTSPRSPAALEEIVSYVGLDIRAHVATEPGILAALKEIADAEPAGQQPPPPGPVAAAPAASDPWQRLWSPPPLTPRDLLRPRGRREPDGIAPAATFPGLAPVPAGAGPAAELLGDEAYTALLRAAEHRDEVGDLLLQRALARVDRCCLLALHSGKIVGWLGRGAGVVLDDLESFAIEAEAPSVLAGLGGGGTFCGPLPSGLANQLLVEVLGDPLPTEVAIVPVPVKNRVVAFLIGDLPGAALPPGAVDELQIAAQKAGVALEILIMRRKFLK
ncbi:MAG: hypothetical protein MUE90_05115 [Thermoanaerobaculales bacterium]|nr:hypothetical protein [Thermoanaerobaculales bacterium]